MQAGVVAAAAEQVSRNVQTVAAGSEQMGASIREIAVSANEAARVASQAVQLGAARVAVRRALGRSQAAAQPEVQLVPAQPAARAVARVAWMTTTLA